MNAERMEGRGKRDNTHLVYQIGDQTLHLIILQPVNIPTVTTSIPIAQLHGRREFINSDPRPPDPLIVNSRSKKNFPKQIPQAYVPPALQSEIDATFDELVLSTCKGFVEGGKGAGADGGC